MTAPRNLHALGVPGQPFAIALERLAGDLIGPPAEGDTIADVPSDRFLTGVLFPPRTGEDEADIEENGTATDETADGDVARRQTAVRPSAAGLSFSLRVPPGNERAIEVEITGARYRPAPQESGRDHWQRTAVRGEELFVLPERAEDYDLGALFGRSFADFN